MSFLSLCNSYMVYIIYITSASFSTLSNPAREMASNFLFLSFILLLGIGLPSTEGHRRRREISPVASIVSEELFKNLFLHKDDSVCPANGFYTYQAFIEATKRFSKFGTTGCLATQKREIAAFLAQISHETTGGWATAPDGPFAWGLCFKEEVNPQSNYCDASVVQWPCSPGKSYKGRGPIQLSW